jgi:hypothetical protein
MLTFHSKDFTHHPTHDRKEHSTTQLLGVQEQFVRFFLTSKFASGFYSLGGGTMLRYWHDTCHTARRLGPYEDIRDEFLSLIRIIRTNDQPNDEECLRLMQAVVVGTKRIL